MTGADDMTAIDPDDEIEPWDRGRRIRVAVLMAFVVMLLWLAAVAVLSVLGGFSAQAGAEVVQDLDLSAGVRELLDGDVERDLEEALTDFDRADRLLNNPVVAPARFIPVVGRQLRSAGALSEASVDVLEASTAAAEVLQDQLDEGAHSGLPRVEAARRLGSEVRTVRAVLADVDLGPSAALVAPLQDARAELNEKLVDAHERASDLVTVLDLLTDIFAGSRYLVVAANNAEMQVGSGMFLSIGEIEFTDGALQISREFEPAGDIRLDEPVPVPDEMQALWGWSAVGSDFRSLGYSARFPVNAPIARDQWSALGRGDVDGVLLVDVVALQAILEIVGPVELEDRTVGSDDVLEFVLQEQYVGADDRDGNQQRRDRLGVIARAALERLDSADLDLVDLLEGLRAARNGRHLMAWAADAQDQSAWVQLGVAGELSETSVLVGLSNIDGSKTDPYLDITVTAAPPAEDGSQVLEIRLRNAVPDGLNDYVRGADGSPDHRGLLVAHLPAASVDVTADGFDGLSAFGRDGPTVVIAAPVAIGQGEERVGYIRFRVPEKSAQPLAVDADARVPPMTWTLGDRTLANDVGLELPQYVR